MNQEFEKVTNWITNRRAIFPNLYSKKKTSDDVIMQLLDNANTAPSHKNTEPWRFHIVANDQLNQLAAAFQAIYSEFMPEDEFSQRKFDQIALKIEQCSHVIGIGMQRDPNERVPEWEEIAAVSCAIQNLWLSLGAAGLCGYWSTPKLMIKHANRFFALAEGERCLGFFYIGIPKPDLNLKGNKGPVTEKIKWYR